MKKNKSNPKGAGRKKGATSCIAVPLHELNRVFRAETLVLVSRAYKPLFDSNTINNTELTTKVIKDIMEQQGQHIDLLID